MTVLCERCKQEISDHISRLGNFMSAISEHCYCAGWMGNLEHDLPKVALEAVRTGQTTEYGMYEITPTDAYELFRLRDLAGGWVTYNMEDDGPRYVLVESLGQ